MDQNKRDGYQPKPPKDGKKPKPPWGGSDVKQSFMEEVFPYRPPLDGVYTPELKFTPNYAPQKIYLQLYGEDDPETLTQEEMVCIPFDEVSWCADQISEFDQEYIRADLYDDPLTDSTDFAHPAWWRAEESSYHMMCHRINEFLDGGGYVAGTSHKELEKIKTRIQELNDKSPAAFTIQCTLVLGVILGIALTYFYPF